jgi:glycerate 2-kinase
LWRLEQEVLKRFKKSEDCNIRVIVAPDSFKGSATNIDIAEAIASGWKSIRKFDEVSLFPMADGGEGSLETIIAQHPHAQRIPTEITFHQGRRRMAYWALLDDGTAIVELAIACGITHLEELDPLGAHTFGFGELILAACRDPRVERIITCLGGSASTDGGVGALTAMGGKFLDSSGNQVPLGGQHLYQIASVYLEEMIDLPSRGLLCLCDVKNPLLGPDGAASTFAPQKGASPEEVAILEEGLSNLLRVSGAQDFFGAGAAGGTSFGLETFLGATIEPGSKVIANLIGLDSALNSCDLLITGEGRFDSQSFEGKVVGTLVNMARRKNVPVQLCVGSSYLDLGARDTPGLTLESLADSFEDSMQRAISLAERIGSELALKC